MVQDDDLGALTAPFNHLQAGLTERQRLQAAFGTYVGPTLAARLLQQGDDVFNSERREVTVFVDACDVTTVRGGNTAEHPVARLNACSRSSCLPSATQVARQQFLGDGAQAVFGAPPT